MFFILSSICSAGNFNETRKAAEQGDANAQYALGMAYFSGELITANPAVTIEWLLKAAKQGHVEAQHIIGVMYQTGNGVVLDQIEAVR